MTNFKPYILFTLALSMIACSSGNNGKQNNASNYNFNNLITNNKIAYTSPPPEVCPGVPIVRDPSLNPPLPDCDDNAPHNNWCTFDDNHFSFMGLNLSHSLVGIEVYNNQQQDWELSCNGAIIGHKWILTAAHCIQDYKTGSTNGNIYVVPWQPAINGIPAKVTTNDQINKYKVATAYITSGAVYESSHTYVYPNYYQDDFALLELPEQLPDSLTPLELADSESEIATGESVLSTAYKKVDGTPYATLNYRDNIYNSNMTFNENSDKNVYLGQLYTTGTSPAAYVHGLPHTKYAWSFMSPEDAGGPLLINSKATGKLKIIGVASTNEHCNYPEFYSMVYLASYANLSVPSYYADIQDIMNNKSHLPTTTCSMDPQSSSYCPIVAEKHPGMLPCSSLSGSPVCVAYESEPGCMGSSSPACSSNPRQNTHYIYVLDQRRYEIITYQQSSDGNLTYLNEVKTGFSPVKIALSQDNKWVLVANSSFHGDTGSISIYKRNTDGTLSAHNPPEFNTGINNPVDVKFYKNDKTYVVNQGNNTVTVHNFTRGTLSAPTYNIAISSGTSSTTLPASISFNNNLAYIVNPKSTSVSIYKVGHLTGNLTSQSDIEGIDTPWLAAGYDDNVLIIGNPLYNACLKQYEKSTIPGLPYPLENQIKLTAPTKMVLQKNIRMTDNQPYGILYVATANSELDLFTIEDNSLNSLATVTAPCSYQQGITIDKSHSYLYLACGMPAPQVIVYRILPSAPWLAQVTGTTISSDSTISDIAVANAD